MRRHELRTAKGCIEALIQANQDCYWYIKGIITPEISEDGKSATYIYEKVTYGDGSVKKELVRSREFRSDDNRLKFDPGDFDHCFGWQETTHEDCHHGQMMFPLGDGEYVLIGFNC